MRSLIDELQNKIFDKTIRTSEALRFGLLVARKLKLADFSKWIDAELNGYAGDSEIPVYRHLPSRIQGWNHIRREWQPIAIQGYSNHPVGQPIGELENLLERTRSEGGDLIAPLPEAEKNQIIKGLYSPSMPPAKIVLFISSAAVYGIIDKVKTLILDWALKLEEAGVTGNDMNFSEKEKESVKNFPIVNNYHSENQVIFQSGQQIQIQQSGQESTLSINTQLLDKSELLKIIEEVKTQIAAFSFTSDQKEEIESEIETLKAQVKSPNPKKSIVQSALISLRSIFENCVGEVAAAAILARLLHLI
jgi:hypothetical protein